MTNQLYNLINQAETLLNNQDFHEALNTYKKICKIDRSNPDAWMALGAVAGNLGKIDEAVSAFNNACNLVSKFGKEHENLIQALELQGKLDEAIKMLLNFNASLDGPADISLRIGILHGKDGNFEASIYWLQKYIDTASNNAYAHHCLASAYESAEEYSNAENHYQLAIQLDPHNYLLYNNYGAMLQKIGNLNKAIRQYNISIQHNDKYALSRYNLGTVYNVSGMYEQAIEHFSTALSLKTDYFEAMIGIGKCYRAIGQRRLAIQFFNNALDVKEDNTEALVNLGYSLIANGDFDAAHHVLMKAFSLDPDNVEIQCSIVMLHERRGDFALAEKLLRPLLSSHSGNKDVVISYTSMCKQLKECQIALGMAEQYLISSSIDPMAKSFIHFKAGKICDDFQNYDDAFDHYKTANQLLPYKYDEFTVRQSFDNITSLFSDEAMRSLPRSSNTSEVPIFILGMPRSGTTLVEQIISSHQHVYGGGELPYLSDISIKVAGAFLSGKESVKYLTEINTLTLDSLADEYLNNALRNTTEASHVTDKMPHNFRLIGLINILFPNAKIVHCIRNPIDNCLSIYFSNLNISHTYANNMLDTAIFYTDYYQPLMEHWYETSTIDIHNVIYEELVDNQEEVSRSILEYCGLEWNDICLDFHKSKRNVATISYDQVRQPIYSTSKQRWRNYEKHISPLIKHFKRYIT